MIYKFFFCVLVVINFFTCIPRLQGTVYVAHDDSGNHGLFSCFSTVLGLLDYYERGACDGVIVDYQNRGLYYEQSKGLNWWNYYFEPIKLIRSNTEQEVLSSGLHGHFALTTYNDLSIDRIHALVKKYIHVKKEIKREINLFAAKYFRDNFVIGVHYRGTDKWSEAPKVAYEHVYHVIMDTIKKYKAKKFVVFLATDEQGMLDFLRSKFKNRLVYTKSIRSTNGQPTHYTSNENFKKGKEAVVDCLLLSKCQFLIRTSSNLSLCSTYFSPKMPVLLVNPGVYDKKN